MATSAAALLALAALHASPAHVAVLQHVSGFAAMMHHLQCRTQTGACSPGVYAESFEAVFGNQAGDAQALQTLATAAQRFAFQAPAVPDLAVRHGFPVNCPTGWNAADRLRVASWMATTPDELERNLTVLMGSAAAHQYAAAAARFWPRYQAYFDAQWRGPLEQFSRELHALVQSPNVNAVLQQAWQFYNPALQPPVYLHVYLMPRPRRAVEPRTGRVNTQATVVDNVATVEVPLGDRASNHVDVVLHELFHHFYASRTPVQHEALMDAFAASDDPQALGLYAILNEAVAAALGNGLVLEAAVGTKTAQAAWAKESGLYNEFFIDRVGSALIRPLQQRLQSGGVLDASFVEPYLKLAHQALGDRADSLQLLLKARSIVYVNAGDKAHALALAQTFRGIDTVVEHAGPSLEATARTRLSVVLLVRWADVAQLSHLEDLVPAPSLAALTRAARTAPRAFSYGIARNPKADVVVLVTRSPADYAPLWEAVLKADHRFVGRGATLR